MSTALYCSSCVINKSTRQLHISPCAISEDSLFYHQILCFCHLIELFLTLYFYLLCREWGDRDRGGYSRNSNSNSSAGANPVRDALVVSKDTLLCGGGSTPTPFRVLSSPSM